MLVYGVQVGLCCSMNRSTNRMSLSQALLMMFLFMMRVNRVKTLAGLNVGKVTIHGS